MLNFIAAVMAAFAFSSSAHADAFSNEDAACTGTCRVHDAAAADKAPAAAKQPARVAATPKAPRRAATGGAQPYRTT